MKLFKNVLQETTLKDVLEESKLSINKNVWSSNRRLWTEELLANNQGTVSVKSVEGDLKNKILSDIDSIIPKTKNTYVNLYIWDVGSGISLHSDENYFFGSTIYLNKKWDLDNGGWFIWQSNDKSWKVIPPEYNSLILNDEKEAHTVTPISYSTSELRATLQIFGEN